MTRSSRQELFAGIGREGQERIRRASVLLVGCGALGSVLAETMVRAGVGRLAIVDRDFVEALKLLAGRTEALLPGLVNVVFADGRAIITGTADAAKARSVYARYVGL